MEDVDLDAGLILSAVDDIESGKYGEVHSMLVYKDGKLVLEAYFPGHDYAWDAENFHGNYIDWDQEERHNIHSVGKSVTSACVGIAVEQGFIESVQRSIFDYLPEHQQFKTDGKDQITIEHLLTMTSGLEWDEWGASYADQTNDVIRLWMDCDDPVGCILEKPLLSEPGTKFTYSGGNMVLLGAIIKNASGMDIEAFSAQYLFAPLGIEPVEWSWIGESGVVYAGGDQYLTPREMLKFGVTYLNSGVWNGEQVISEEWVQHSARPYPGPGSSWFNNALRPIPPDDGARGRRGYAYTWWTHQYNAAGKTIPAYWAGGWGGQAIRILPDHEIVVVFTGANYNSADASAKIMKEYVIPAVK
jgi:CubicO group peptidase (beta-lactamase class C family)